MPTDLVHNERTKPLANALDRSSTAALAVGVLGPVVTATYGFGTPDRGTPLPVLVFGTNDVRRHAEVKAKRGKG